MTSTSLTPESTASAPEKPVILSVLPDFPIASQQCALHLQQHIDLMLLALESLEVGAGEALLALCKELGLDKIVKNRIIFWRLRCTNPWRISYTLDRLTLDQAKALVIIASYRAKPLAISIRQLLLARQQMESKGLPVDNNFLLSEYLERFRSNFRSRMNPRRAKVSVYLADENALNELALSLLDRLLFCTGTTGMQRFWISLFDGEIV
ncbi:MAG: DUF3038 domain-containing protein [Microcystis sp. 53598_E5]|jgi:hypothetical protein|uniref:DUF3038 domain-containing protein n=3 Tax=Microcystis aeruginosa TaxID=1126 RepID=A0A5J4FBB8_MICAE|nr:MULTISPECIES: DUF3038 domain-containing protein [Microcystis]MCE2672929.1 DUF3038 domain-containing protein [Microcystis sp. 53598_E5]TRU29570.1 MAG: DUF3038 domain-containing protein [Microcystis aeruginosa Ma_SC_T_19800800_S464]MCA2625197.1 DUF3038 domain-containing protein [Microcystis sp. M19BS1]MCA2635169.1 DUF3038 domain-containing protein [Microcystis sp. M20BS1]MDJ0671502.1 DUF3038 domain-containing protein [Microcystis sp. M53598_WE2]